MVLVAWSAGRPFLLAFLPINCLLNGARMVVDLILDRRRREGRAALAVAPLIDRGAARRLGGSPRPRFSPTAGARRRRRAPACGSVRGTIFWRRCAVPRSAAPAEGGRGQRRPPVAPAPAPSSYRFALRGGVGRALRARVAVGGRACSRRVARRAPARRRRVRRRRRRHRAGVVAPVVRASARPRRRACRRPRATTTTATAAAVATAVARARASAARGGGGIASAVANLGAAALRRLRRRFAFFFAFCVETPPSAAAPGSRLEGDPVGARARGGAAQQQ